MSIHAAGPTTGAAMIATWLRDRSFSPLHNPEQEASVAALRTPPLRTMARVRGVM
jgi:hypothetical protein